MDDQQRLEALRTVCAIDSRTAPGAAGTVEVAKLLGQRLEALGFELQWFDPWPEEGRRGRHLRAVRNPEAATRVLLVGHTDTINAPADVPFRIDDSLGRVQGSGVSDMKGGDLLLIEAVELALAADPAVREMGLVVLLNCCEETAGPSFRQLARESATGAAACLVFEPARPGPEGEHRIVVARKAVLRFELKVHGRAAHAGNDHHLGVSAAREVARKVEQLEALTDYQRSISVNVGVIQSGQTANQVPDEALAVFDVRAFDPVILEQVCDRIRAICAEPTVRSAGTDVPTRLELSMYEAYPPWPASPEGQALAARYIELAHARGATVTTIEAGGGSDANHVADLIPTLDGLGVIGGGAHSVDEWADITTMGVRAQIAADMIRSLCANPPAPLATDAARA